MDILYSILRDSEIAVCKLYPLALHRLSLCDLFIVEITVCVLILHSEVVNVAVLAAAAEDICAEAVTFTCLECAVKFLQSAVP